MGLLNSRGKLTIAIKLNPHDAKLPSKYLCVFPSTTANSSLGQKNDSLRLIWVNAKTMAAQHVEHKTQLRAQL